MDCIVFVEHNYPLQYSTPVHPQPLITMNIDFNKQSRESFSDAAHRGTVEFQVLLVVQALRLIFSPSQSPDYGAWGFLRSAYHDEHAGALYLRYSFGPEVAYSTDLPVVDDPRPGREVWLKLVSKSLCTGPDSEVAEEARFTKIRELAQELAMTAFLATTALFDELETASEPWSAHASRDLMPQCQEYDMGPLPSVYLDTRITRKPSRDMLLQSSPIRRQSAGSSTQTSKSH
ncbi:hypothetical protein CPB85DRAFT_368769 [Mucidula mucida]|nr:hypothetical protein CPB85DRAFT_368769 [Mucidula mucida]